MKIKDYFHFRFQNNKGDLKKIDNYLNSDKSQHKITLLSYIFNNKKILFKSATHFLIHNKSF